MSYLIETIAQFKHIVFCATDIFECEKKKKSYDIFEDTKWGNQKS